MNLFDVKDVTDALRQYTTTNGNGGRALDIVEEELHTGFKLGKMTDKLRMYGTVLVRIAETTGGAMMPWDEKRLIISIRAISTIPA